MADDGRAPVEAKTPPSKEDSKLASLDGLGDGDAGGTTTAGRLPVPEMGLLAGESRAALEELGGAGTGSGSCSGCEGADEIGAELAGCGGWTGPGLEGVDWRTLPVPAGPELLRSGTGVTIISWMEVTVLVRSPSPELEEDDEPGRPNKDSKKDEALLGTWRDSSCSEEVEDKTAGEEVGRAGAVVFVTI